MKNIDVALNKVKSSLRNVSSKMEEIGSYIPSLSVDTDNHGSSVRIEFPAWLRQLRLKQKGLCGVESDNWPGGHFLRKTFRS